MCKYTVTNFSFDKMIFIRHMLNQKGEVLNTDNLRVASKSHNLSIEKKILTIYLLLAIVVKD